MIPAYFALCVAAFMFSEGGVEARNRRNSEPKPGEWESLFSGRSHQFRGYKLYDFPRKSWKVDRGELKSIEGAPQVDLVSLALYDEFELEVEWRVTSGAQGGILYLVMEDEGPTWHSGLEYRLVDDSQSAEAKNPNRGTGSLFDVAPAKASKPIKPPGQYNTTLIRVQKGNVEHWLNGELVLSIGLKSPEFSSGVAASKFKNLPRFGREREGHVSLQHMGDEVAFRSIRIRRLAAGTQASLSMK